LLESLEKPETNKETWLVSAQKFVAENESSSYAALTALLTA
jgi:predicted negative regulator of RcsB-dependent stress response